MIQKYGGEIKIAQFLDIGSLQWTDLLCLDGHLNETSKRCETCWYNILGECKLGEKCPFYKNHVFGKAPPDEYVEEVLKVLKPPLDKMVYEDIPIQHNQYTRDAKRGRR